MPQPYIKLTYHNYDKYTSHVNIYKEDLMAAVFHPRRFERYLLQFDMNDL